VVPRRQARPSMSKTLRPRPPRDSLRRTEATLPPLLLLAVFNFRLRRLGPITTTNVGPDPSTGSCADAQEPAFRVSSVLDPARRQYRQLKRARTAISDWSPQVCPEYTRRPQRDLGVLAGQPRRWLLSREPLYEH
jgi:hypothetical protein